MAKNKTNPNRVKEEERREERARKLINACQSGVCDSDFNRLDARALQTLIDEGLVSGWVMFGEQEADLDDLLRILTESPGTVAEGDYNYDFENNVGEISIMLVRLNRADKTSQINFLLNTRSADEVGRYGHGFYAWWD